MGFGDLEGGQVAGGNFGGFMGLTWSGERLVEALSAEGTDLGPPGLEAGWGWGLCQWDPHPVSHRGPGP